MITSAVACGGFWWETEATSKKLQPEAQLKSAVVFADALWASEAHIADA